MPNRKANDTMPKFGHVTEVREQWLVRTDGALANHLQDEEISTHLCSNRYRNQQIREDFPMALSEQRCLENEARHQQMIKQQQADYDAEIARRVAKMNLRGRQNERVRHQHSNSDERRHSAHSSRYTERSHEIAHSSHQHLFDIPSPAFQHEQATTSSSDAAINDLDVEALGLSHTEVMQMKMRLEQEERDAMLARELMAKDGTGEDALMADMRCAVEAQDGELARLLQDREYKKLQKAKEKARQRALAKKQQKLVDQHKQTPATLADAYSDPRDIIEQRKTVSNQWSSKSVDSDLNYVEPFEKEYIQCKAEALHSKERSQDWFAENRNADPYLSQSNGMRHEFGHSSRHSMDSIDNITPNVPYNNNISFGQHRQPPPVPTSSKKPRFPDPVSIRPASHYTLTENSPVDEHPLVSHIDNNLNNNGNSVSPGYGSIQSYKSSDTYDGVSVNKKWPLAAQDNNNQKTKKSKNNDGPKKKKGCKIQ